MKALLLLTLLLTACASTTPHPRCACSRNLNACVAAYDDGDQALAFCQGRGYKKCAREDWNALCANDLQVCQGE